MPVDLDAVGSATDPFPVSWDSTRTLLYAIGVGAGAEDVRDELQFTTENSDGVEQAVLPTFPVVLGAGGPRLPFGTVDFSRLVQAQQSIRLTGPFPVAGTGFVTTRIDGIYDKGSGALVTRSSQITDADGKLLAETTGGSFIRGEGGFGGDRGPATDWALPAREPDIVKDQLTVPWQALLYRLSGDRNPLHSDPTFAARGGFERPILHGLCTFGFAGRALLHGVAESDPARLRSVSARFSAPVYPGETLRTSIWKDGDQALFTTESSSGVTVLTHGRAELGPA
ncbi:MaoC/PaaZ C-terminal domain-containing protein [Jatrophihabitans sp. DSM 45814]